MKIISNINDINLKNTVIILGKFDGFHLGHRLLVDTASELRTADESIVLFTFNIPPARLLKDIFPNADISSNSTKTIETGDEREIFSNEKCRKVVDYIIEFPFNVRTMSMEPEEFVKEILVDRLGVDLIVAGSDFRFGKDRKGDVSQLGLMGSKYGFKVKIVEKAVVKLPDRKEPQEISSTLIKEEIARGSMSNVEMMLGRPYSIRGVIRHGKHLGHTIGFPTINIDIPEGKIIPPNGVYYTQVIIDGSDHKYDSITNVGVRPSIDDGDKQNTETNIFDFNKDIYGRSAKVEFIKYIRPEIKFNNIGELQKQIKCDIITVHELIKSYDI